jgi:hypothetical protein
MFTRSYIHIVTAPRVKINKRNREEKKEEKEINRATHFMEQNSSRNRNRKKK